MCGIVGILGGHFTLNAIEKKVFKEMLIADAVRGEDATGVFGITKEGKIQTLKIGSHPFALFNTKEWEEFIEKEYITLIGHNRLATSGGTDTANAHPFKKKHITMVHNGTLKAATWLPDYDKFKVDSEALCNGIAEIGLDEALKRTHGAYAVALYNEEDKKLNLFRNTESPCVLRDYNLNRLLIASEPGMLDWISGRMNSHMAVRMLTTNVNYKFPLGSCVPDMEILPTEKSYRPAKNYPTVSQIPLIGMTELEEKLATGGPLTKRQRRELSQARAKHAAAQTAYENATGFKIDEQIYFYQIGASAWGNNTTQMLVEGWMDGLDGGVSCVVPKEQMAVMENITILRANIKRIQKKMVKAPTGEDRPEWVLWCAKCEPVWNFTDMDDLEEQRNKDDSQIEAGFSEEYMKKYNEYIVKGTFPITQEGTKSLILLPGGCSSSSNSENGGNSCSEGNISTQQTLEDDVADLEFLDDIALEHNILH